MAASGNLASKGHVQMLDEIERLLDVVSQAQPMQPEELEPDIFEWINSIDDSGYLLDQGAFLS